MKKKIIVFTLIAGMFTAITALAQEDKSKRASPPAKVSETIKSGATITIDYSQPSVKGRTIGKEIAPFGEVWRTGANEATVFETSKDIMVEGKVLPAGKYSLYSIPGEEKWTFIFNKTWKQWGTNYKQDDDVLRVDVKTEKTSKSMEKMTFEIEKDGEVSLMWGNYEAELKIK
ncbi:MAG: DUF2911 domain-containing protein [Daejeonella sp.]